MKTLRAEEIRRRLAQPAASVAGCGPASAALPYGGEADLHYAFDKRAAVLIPIFEYPEHLTVLFTRRTAHLKHHSGQVAFPGGRVETHDRSVEETALRETREEIGLDPGRVRVVGRLDDYHARVSGYRITPVVGTVSLPVELAPDPSEVDEIFEVPIDYLFDPAHHGHEIRHTDDGPKRTHVIEYGAHRIWGATAAIVLELYRRLAP